MIQGINLQGLPNPMVTDYVHNMTKVKYSNDPTETGLTDITT